MPINGAEPGWHGAYGVPVICGEAMSAGRPREHSHDQQGEGNDREDHANAVKGQPPRMMNGPIGWQRLGQPFRDRDVERAEPCGPHAHHAGNTLRLAKQLEELTGLEARLTILGYVQRGGTPSVTDRILATRLGSACVALIKEGRFGVMVAARGNGTTAVPIADVAGNLRLVPTDHEWVRAARRVGTCLGD